MLLPNDDEIARVDAVFLGPKGWTLPWRATYAAYGIGFAVSVVLLIIEHRLRIGLNLFSVAYSGMIVVVVTRWLAAKVTYEVTVRALLVAFWHELNAPRPGRKPQHVTFRPGRIRNRWTGKVKLRGNH